MVANECCRTELTNGAELNGRMVQNCADEWCKTVRKNFEAVLMNGAELCFYCWSKVALKLVQRELRSSYGSWPVSEVRSLWKNTAHN